ncbi:MAG: tetratricopeptide repeat protein [Bacteroidota bacterium]
MSNTVSKPKSKPGAVKGSMPSPNLLKKQGTIESISLLQLLAIMGALVVITFVAFLPALRNSFVLWDDPGYVYENGLLKNFSFARVYSFSTFVMGNYHPLTITWLHWESLIFPKGNPAVYSGFDPFWFHLNNLLLHLLNTTLVFLVVYELLDRKGWKTAAVTALLFGIHPMHVESVTWISEIKDVLFSFFFLLAAWMYLHYTRRRNYGILAGSFVLFILSCLAKGQAVTLPLAFLLFDYFRGRKFDKTAILEKIPFFIVSLLFGLLAIRAQGTGINKEIEVVTNILYGWYGLLLYLLKLVLPVNLSGSYPYPSNTLKQVPYYLYIAPVILVALCFAVYKTLKFSKDYLFGFLFFLFTISITLRFIPLGDSYIADRYTYIPYIGLFFICGRLFSRFADSPRWNKLAVAVLVVLTMVLGTLTWNRTQVWKNSFTFWEDVSAQYPDYWRPHFCMGCEYVTGGNYQKALENFNFVCDREASAPTYVYLSRAALYVNNLKEYDKGIADYQKVLDIKDESGMFASDRLEARKNMGLAYNKKGDFANALKILDELIGLDPEKPVNYFLKGNALEGLGRFAAADSAFTHAINLSPGYTDAYQNRGILYTDKIGAYEKGIADFKKVLELQPGNTTASVNLGVCYFKDNKPGEAIAIFSSQIAASPADGRLYYLRSLAYAQDKNYTQAYNDLAKAKDLKIAVSEKDLNEVRMKAKIKG